MKIGHHDINSDAPPFVIAEIGVNHDGDPQRALELVDAAQQCDANAVKFQLFEAERLLSRASRLADYQRRSGESDPATMLKRLELSIDNLAAIVDRAHELGLAAIVTVFSLELVAPAAKLAWDAWKVASPDIINRPLIEELLTTNRPVLLSTGAATLEEVQRAVGWVQHHPYILMQCVSAYPTPDTFAALAGRIGLERISPYALGYSDHTTNTLTGGFAVAGGARVLEKHLTHDCQADGPDHGASLNPQQFAEYVRYVHEAFAMLGPPRKEILDIERDVRHLSRQSIVATVELKPGQTITRDDLTIKRPGSGLTPALLDDIIGRTVTRTIECDMPVTPEALQ